MTFYLVVLAMVAGFLAMRLYSVLGKRTGHEQQPLPRAADERAVPPADQRRGPAPAEARVTAGSDIEPGAEAGLRRIVSAEPGFDVAEFLDGAKGAYRMILEAFWKGDERTLYDLCAPEVKAAFSQAIAEREAAGHVLDNRLVSIERAVVADAGVDGREARVTVRFDADVAAVTRDRDGQVVAGSLTDAVETHDVWTFARTLRSGNPNWTLADTDTDDA